MKQLGQGIETLLIHWRDVVNKSLSSQQGFAPTQRITIIESEGWRRLTQIEPVPQEAHKATVVFSVEGQNANVDTIWFRHAEAYCIT